MSNLTCNNVNSSFVITAFNNLKYLKNNGKKIFENNDQKYLKNSVIGIVGFHPLISKMASVKFQIIKSKLAKVMTKKLNLYEKCMKKVLNVEKCKEKF